MTTKSAYETVRDTMAPRTAKMTLDNLCTALLFLEGRELDKAERIVQAVLADEICKRSPEAQAAADHWARDEDMWELSCEEVIVAAALGAEVAA